MNSGLLFFLGPIGWILSAALEAKEKADAAAAQKKQSEQAYKLQEQELALLAQQQAHNQAMELQMAQQSNWSASQGEFEGTQATPPEEPSTRSLLGKPLA